MTDRKIKPVIIRATFTSCKHFSAIHFSVIAFLKSRKHGEVWLAQRDFAKLEKPSSASRTSLAT
jgi:hypothetical protein